MTKCLLKFKINWFLYDRDFPHERVKVKFSTYKNLSGDLSCKPSQWFLYDESSGLNLFQPNVKLYIETSHLFFRAYHVTRFHMKYNT